MGRRELLRLLQRQALSACGPGELAGAAQSNVLNAVQTRGVAQAAVKLAPSKVQQVSVPAVQVDLFGAISVVPEGEKVSTFFSQIP